MKQTDRPFDLVTPTDADSDSALTRRTFLHTSALAIGSLVIGGLPRLSSAQVARNPLKIPPLISPYGFTLTCAPGTSDLGGGAISNVLAYNGVFPGPTFVAWRGDTVHGHLVNNLSEETITHWHGMVVDHHNDGSPHHTVMPGASRHYEFPVIQRAALNWYHPHTHMTTGRQVNLGLAGAFIIRDDEEKRLNLPAGAYEVPLIIRDATLRGSNLEFNAPASGFNGRRPMVNGTLNPKLNVDRGLYRFRVLNGANARVFRLALSNGAPFLIIGNDGGFLPAPVKRTEITLGMGERLDLLVDFRALSAGSTVMLRCLDAGWDLLQFVGTVSFQPASHGIRAPRPPDRETTWNDAPWTWIGCGPLPPEINRQRSTTPNGTVKSIRFMSNS